MWIVILLFKEMIDKEVYKTSIIELIYTIYNYNLSHGNWFFLHNLIYFQLRGNLSQVVDQKSKTAISTIDYRNQFQPITENEQLTKQANNNRNK